MIADAAPIPASAAAPGPSAGPDAPATPNLDPADYDSLWYKPLRLWGVTPQRLSYFGVQVVKLRNDRAFHPAEATPRVWWQYPVWDEDDVTQAQRLAAVDGKWPRSDWLGPPRPDLLYVSHLVIPHEPVIVCGDVFGVWVLASMDVPACTFLCGPNAQPPAHAIAQIARARPSFCIVVDNERSSLPGGAAAVAGALQAAGVEAGYVLLPGYLGNGALHGATTADLAALVGFDRASLMDTLAELARGRRP